VHVIDLANGLIAAHIMDWYGDELPTNSQGVAVIEWSELQKFVQAARPDFWPAASVALVNAAGAAKTKPPAAKARRPGRPPRERKRVEDMMRADIESGEYTIARLKGLFGKELAARYRTTRYTANEALRNVAAEAERRVGNSIPDK
jgi:hypothetical protein